MASYEFSGNFEILLENREILFDHNRAFDYSAPMNAYYDTWVYVILQVATLSHSMEQNSEFSSAAHFSLESNTVKLPFTKTALFLIFMLNLRQNTNFF